MSNQEILGKAIQKAVDGGWIPDSPDWTPFYLSHYFNWQVYVYDHGFAKALWGEDETINDNQLFIPDWQYHLIQMVIADDPIKYLGENL